MRIAILLATATALAGCATTGGGYGRPAEVIRYHLGTVERGTVVVQPAEGGDGLFDQPFAQAVSRELNTLGYVPAAPGGQVQYLAIVDIRRRAAGPPRRTGGFSIGLGGGGFSSGRNSGVGLGGGVSVPVGGRTVQPEGTEMTVTIKRRVDQSPVWEGQARLVENSRAPKEAVAEKLARALFTGFPGESGRTIEVE